MSESTAVFWTTMGTLGLLAMLRDDAARIYALIASVVFVVVAVWGDIDGNDVRGLLVADTTNTVMHTILAAMGFGFVLMPRAGQRSPEALATNRRFDRGGTRREDRRPTRGR